VEKIALDTSAAESAAWRLAGIAQDLRTEAQTLAGVLKRGNEATDVRIVRIGKLIAQAGHVADELRKAIENGGNDVRAGL
jgi:hypothetical protein